MVAVEVCVDNDADDERETSNDADTKPDEADNAEAVVDELHVTASFL